MANRATITIAGAGPVGAMLAIVLARRGYRVKLFESRPDSRRTNLYQGRSINIALSDRGWLALESIGLDEVVRNGALPMHRRLMHDEQGKLSEQPYGKAGQCIWSVSRAGINEQLLSAAEAESNVSIFFEHKLIDVDFPSAAATFQSGDGQVTPVEADYLFGADGAYSKVRRLAQETPRFSYSQTYMPESYIELHIPAGSDGAFQLAPDALHIWPRGSFMLIALPNPDGSFTCTLFMAYEGEPSFTSLMERHTVADFFEKYFGDALEYLEDPISDYLSKTAAPLSLVHVYPWVIDSRVALIGDAAHAIVPYYGQGMNCGLEDCRVLAELIDSHDHDWARIFPAYQESRKPNADAIAELARRNFVEMSDLAGDPLFLLRKKIEGRFQDQYPDLWTPLYSMVTFSPRLPYADALDTGDRQKAIMDQIMALPNIESEWENEHVYRKLHHLAVEQFG